MYSRSLDPRRAPTPLPKHYGGSAFRSDGTPTPIPVRMEYDASRSGAGQKGTAESEPAEEDVHPVEDAKKASVDPHDEEHAKDVEAGTHGSDRDRNESDCGGVPFLSRFLGGLLPGVREDDLLLLLLILLLSKEEGNEDVLLLLAFILLAK